MAQAAASLTTHRPPAPPLTVPPDVARACANAIALTSNRTKDGDLIVSIPPALLGRLVGEGRDWYSRKRGVRA